MSVEDRLAVGRARHRIVVARDDAGRSYPGAERCLHELIEEQARRTPDAPALVCGGTRFSYAELDRRANQLAHRLRRLGARPGSRIGVAAHRSPELVVGVLGVLKAGAAYLPIDPSSPARQQAHMLVDADPVIVLAQERLTADLPRSRAAIVVLDSAWEDVATEPDGPTAHGATADDRAYISSDVAVWEFFRPLLTGATLVVAGPGAVPGGLARTRDLRDLGVEGL